MSLPRASPAEIAAEARQVRRLQLLMDLVMTLIRQSPSLPVEEASELAAWARGTALAMFPDKELAYDLIYRPRFQRLLAEKYGLQ